MSDDEHDGLSDDDLSLQRARAALALRRPDEARRLLAPLVARDPSDAYALLLLGEAAAALGERAEVGELAHRAAAAAPGDADVLLGCGFLAYRSGAHHVAYLWGCEVLARRPGSADARRLLALSAADSGRSREAVEHGRACVELGPDQPGALVAYAHALSASRRNADATVQLVRALAEDPVHLDALSALGFERMFVGDVGRCGRYLARVMELEPSYAYGLDNLKAAAANARLALLARVAVTGLAAWTASLLGGLAVGAALLLGVGWLVVAVVALPGVLRRRLLADWEGRDVALVALIGVGLIGFPLLVLGVGLVSTMWLERVAARLALRRAGLSLPGRPGRRAT